jgi:pimeloyl-ACP methyl ester carboxylesterase
MLYRMILLGAISLSCHAIVACMTAVSWYEIDENITWQSEERLGLGTNHQLVRQYLDSESRAGESFYLFYFTHVPKASGEHAEGADPDAFRDKTILFVSGGPGENVGFDEKTDIRRFLDLPGYRVVYFHLRGSGFSQVPDSNVYDKYIRTEHAARDIELIRKRVLGSDETGRPRKWAAVVGYSYGTVLAQEYADSHEDSVAKLILAGPMSRHSIKSPSDSAGKESMRTEMRKINLHTLEKIYSAEVLKEFLTIVGGADPSVLTESLLDDVGKIVSAVEKEFGSLPLFIDSYDELKKNPDKRNSEVNYLFEYPPSFFNALRKIRMEGWIPNENGSTNGQTRIGLLVAEQILGVKKEVRVDEKLADRIKEFLTEKTLKFAETLSDEEKTSVETLIRSDVCAMRDKIVKPKAQEFPPADRPQLAKKWAFVNLIEGDLCAVRAEGVVASQSSKRAYYVINHYDGLDLHNLQDMMRRETKINRTLVNSHTPRLMDMFLSKVGFSPNEARKPWDPKDHSHGISTLIVSGRADPVSANGTADHFFEHGLQAKDKILLEFPALGHNMDLPSFTPSQALQEQLKKVRSCRGTKVEQTRSCIFDAFIDGALDQKGWGLLLEEIGFTYDCGISKLLGPSETDRRLRIRDHRDERFLPLVSCSS